MDKPTIPKGTRDFGPAQMAKRQFIFDNIRKVFQKYGFQPLETPAMENLSTLTGKYGEEGDQLLFKILNSGKYFESAQNELKDELFHFGNLRLMFGNLMIHFVESYAIQNKLDLVDLILFSETFSVRFPEKINKVFPELKFDHFLQEIKERIEKNAEIVQYNLNESLIDFNSTTDFRKEKESEALLRFVTHLFNKLFPEYLEKARDFTNEISEKGLRYDLTVPFARYVVMNRGEITFPFKRYQIQPVWRADRPQKGRYREFYQCDADVVGTDSLICEAEIVLMIKEVFKLLGIKDFTIKINHRAILSGLAELTSSQNESSLFVGIDKLDKIGEEKVKEELRSRGFEDKGIDSVFAILNFKGSTQQKIDFLKSKFSNSEKGKKGIADFEEVLSLLKSYGAGEENVEFDISLARGLSYYTGCIFEVKINNVAIGSVSGGGRYDNLTGVFGLPDVSGVGISFGVDRLYDAMEELKIFPKEAQVSSKVMIAHFDDATLRYSLSIAHQLRESGISTEVYPDVTKLKKQLDYANKKEIPFVIVVGSDEMKDGILTLKNMEKGEQEKLSVVEVISKLKK
ncbi:MAG: histidine--tRNA ligase [Cyclobacteriaceae bacterium]